MFVGIELCTVRMRSLQWSGNDNAWSQTEADISGHFWSDSGEWFSNQSRGDVRSRCDGLDLVRVAMHPCQPGIATRVVHPECQLVPKIPKAGYFVR